MCFAALETERCGEQFPIKLDDVWELSGYADKGKTYRFLTQRTSLESGIHFLPERVKSPRGGRPSESIMMSTKAFRFFLSKSNTPNGDETLWHLIEIEELYKKNLERQLQASDSVGEIKEIERLKKENQELQKLLKKEEYISQIYRGVIVQYYNQAIENGLSKIPGFRTNYDE